MSEGNNRDRTVAAGVSVLIAGRKVRSKKRMLADMSGGPVTSKSVPAWRKSGVEWGKRREQGKGKGGKWMKHKERRGHSVLVVVAWCRWLGALGAGTWLVTCGRWLLLVAD